MRYSVVLVLLLISALLEAGGDALMRSGMYSATAWQRAALMPAGALTLTLYGYTVNAPPWDFGRLLGTYIAFFFIIVQLIAWVGFGQKPTLSLVVGGTLIVAGGYIVSRG